MQISNKEQYLQLIECRLADILANSDSDLIEPIRYSVLSGGKRFRPLLSIAGGKLNAADPVAVINVGCALELIHCYSLVHDDLPAMDNDDLRRGQPTCHKKYNEATAILVGDALQALAFEVLSMPDASLLPVNQLKIIHLIGKSSGIKGMVGGQMLDLLSTGHTLNLSQLQKMHASKTGALIKAAVLSGYLCGADFSLDMYTKLGSVADGLGLLFQIVDDILDVTGTSAVLGKTANKDAINDKVTYVSLLGLEEAQAVARELHTEILADLSDLENSLMLKEIADSIYIRNY